MATKRNSPSGPRVRSLRIGIILGKKIIEERLFRERDKITIGQSATNTFCIPARGLPKSFPLFTVENGRYVLNFDDNFDLTESRVAAEGKIQKLAEAKGQGRGGPYRLVLPESARGKVVVPEEVDPKTGESRGGMTLLFQFVNAPPLQPRPRLPASVRGTLADRIDPHLAIILLLSLLLHGGITIWALFFADPYVGSKMERARQEFEREVYQEATIATFKVPTEPTETAETAEDESQNGNTNTPTPPTNRPTGGGGKTDGKTAGNDSGDGGDDGGPDDAAIDEAIENTAMLKMLTGGAGDGSPFGKMSETDQGAGLASQIDGVTKSGAVVATTGGAGSDRGRGSNSGKIGSGKGPGVTGIKEGDAGSVGEKTETKISSRVDLSGVDDIDMTSLDPDAVARRIRSRYLAGIKRCHENALKRDPKAGGRVNLKFTVSIAGKVVKADVSGFDPDVDQCISSQMRAWSFPAPKDDDGNPTTAGFVIPLVLKAGS